MDLQRREIELVEIVLRFFRYCGCKLFFLFGKISFRRRQPACDNVKGGPVTIIGRNLIERVAGKIELSKAERRGNETKLTVRILGGRGRDLSAVQSRIF